MKTNIDKFKDICTNEDKMLLTVKKILNDFDPSPNEVVRYYLTIMEAQMRSSINTIFQHAETKVEKLFLSSLLLKAALENHLLITFTNPLPSLDETIKSIQKEFRSQTEFWNTFKEIAGDNPPMSYIDFIDSIPELSEQTKGDMIEFYTLYIIFNFYKLFHISLKTTFTDIIMKDQFFRPDILIWLPSNPSFKLIVEVNDFDAYSDKSSIPEIKTRDQILKAKGFQVIRFPKDEIEDDPLSKSGELFNYLLDQQR